MPSKKNSQNERRKTKPAVVHDVVETKQIPPYDQFPKCNIDADINEYLKAGWIILDHWSQDRLYVLLGWVKKDHDAVHPTLPSGIWASLGTPRHGKEQSPST